MNCFPKKSAECIDYVPPHSQTNQQWHNRTVCLCRVITLFFLNRICSSAITIETWGNLQFFHSITVPLPAVTALLKY